MEGHAFHGCERAGTDLGTAFRAMERTRAKVGGVFRPLVDVRAGKGTAFRGSGLRGSPRGIRISPFIALASVRGIGPSTIPLRHAFCSLRLRQSRWGTASNPLVGATAGGSTAGVSTAPLRPRLRRSAVISAARSAANSTRSCSSLICAR